MSTLFGDFPLPGVSPALAGDGVDYRGVPTWAEAGGEPPPDGAGRHTHHEVSRDPAALL